MSSEFEGFVDRGREEITVNGLKLVETIRPGQSKNLDTGKWDNGFIVTHDFYVVEKDLDIGCSDFYKTEEELRKALSRIRRSHARAIKEKRDSL